MLSQEFLAEWDDNFERQLASGDEPRRPAHRVAGLKSEIKILFIASRRLGACLFSRHVSISSHSLGFYLETGHPHRLSVRVISTGPVARRAQSARLFSSPLIGLSITSRKFPRTCTFQRENPRSNVENVRPVISVKSAGPLKILAETPVVAALVCARAVLRPS